MIIFRPCRPQYTTRSGTRAMVPSSFMISQMTPAGVSPAIRARSTAASVCPARASTPPSRATRGNTCPGRTRSSGRAAGSMATWMVRARSAAEMPVVTPCRASMDTVNAVPKRDWFSRAIGCRCSAWARSSVRARQIRPRPWSGHEVDGLRRSTNCAAMVRSPSFSLSSSSTTTTMRPALISSSASGMVQNSASLSHANPLSRSSSSVRPAAGVA